MTYLLMSSERARTIVQFLSVWPAGEQRPQYTGFNCGSVYRAPVAPSPAVGLES